MGEVKVEVIGTEPPCMRCRALMKIVKKVAENLRKNGVSVKVEKVNILSKEVVSKYGVLVSPALAINGTVKIVGRVPGEKEVENLIRSAAER